MTAPVTFNAATNHQQLKPSFYPTNIYMPPRAMQTQRDTFHYISSQHTSPLRFGTTSTPAKTNTYIPVLGLHTSSGEQATRYVDYFEEQLAEQAKDPQKAKIYQDLKYNTRHPAQARVVKVQHYEKDGEIYTTNITLDVSNSNFHDSESERLRILPGQHVGILPPNIKEDNDDKNKDLQKVRWYSIASPTTGEDGKGKLLHLIIRRAPSTQNANERQTLVSNYIARLKAKKNDGLDLRKGDTVSLIGPVTNRFLGPSNPETPIVCLGVGTSVAPYDAIIRERFENQQGQFGDAFLGMGYVNQSLGYAQERFQEFAKNPENNFTFKAAYSKQDGEPKQHITDIAANNAKKILEILKQDNAHMYISGFLGIDRKIRRELIKASPNARETATLIRKLITEKRWHVESSSVPASDSRVAETV